MTEDIYARAMELMAEKQVLSDKIADIENIIALIKQEQNSYPNKNMIGVKIYFQDNVYSTDLDIDLILDVLDKQYKRKTEEICAVQDTFEEL